MGADASWVRGACADDEVVPASITMVRFRFGRDTGSCSRHGYTMLTSPSPPWRLGCKHTIGSTVSDLIHTLVGDIRTGQVRVGLFS